MGFVGFWNHLNLGQYGGDTLPDSTVPHFFPQGILQIITDVPLTHGHTDRQWTGGVFLGVAPCKLRHCVLNQANLWSIAVGDNNLMTLFNQIHNCFCGVSDSDQLLLQIVAQSVSTQRNYDTLSHFITPCMFFKENTGPAHIRGLVCAGPSECKPSICRYTVSITLQF